MTLTDKEIIKALECCEEDYCHASQCPAFRETKEGEECRTELIKLALSFINRLQDEKEALINGQETLQKTIVEQKTEIGELRKGFTADMDYFASEYDTKIKTEAIKEFARIIKTNINCDLKYSGECTAYDAVNHIDNLVKELTE